MNEHTETARQRFLDEVKTDPYLHALTYHVANAWADGYEQALRDNDLGDELDRKTHDDRFKEALEWLTEATLEARAQALTAMAMTRRTDIGPA